MSDEKPSAFVSRFTLLLAFYSENAVGELDLEVHRSRR